MSLGSMFKSIFAAGAKELSKEYGKNTVFLEGVVASCALVAFADGTLEDSEKKAIEEIITGHTQLSGLYERQTIQQKIDWALRHGTSNSGKQELSRALDNVKNSGNPTMCDDVYLMAKDVAGANSHAAGGIADQEKGVLSKIANRLSVDETKFEF